MATKFRQITKFPKVNYGNYSKRIIIPPLGKPPAHFDLARKGVTDIAWGIHGYTLDRFPLEYCSMLPFYSNSAKAASVALWRTYEKYFAKFKAYTDVKLLGLDVHGPAMIFTTKKKIRSVADMKNIKKSGLATASFQKLVRIWVWSRFSHPPPRLMRFFPKA